MLVMTDADIDPIAAMPLALEAVEAALRANATGGLVAPPRHRVAFPAGTLFFTIGGDARVAGFRVYDTFGGPAHGQLTVVWSAQTGELMGMVLGERLGEVRTGAIGGIAIREMSVPDATTIGLVGSGPQARAQLIAAAAVRSLRHARVFSRDARRRADFVRQMSDADIVICATSSESPVIEARWLRPGAHVNTVGPKTVAAHEVGIDVAQGAAVIATDSPAQTQTYGAPFFLAGPEAGRMVDLARIVAGEARGRLWATDITLFCSAGLAGTEVVVADRLLAIAGRQTELSRAV